MKTITLLLILTTFAITGLMNAQSKSTDKDSSMSISKQQQLIIWTSGDREVALKMVFMYAFNCRKYSWMDNVRLLIWGPSDKLLVDDAELQKQLKELKDAGVELYACKGCADMYGISDKLTELGVTVMYTGKMLADLQKEGWHVLSF